MTGTTVPLIDISAFDGGTKDAKDKVKLEVTKALEEVGFFVVTGHGVPTHKVDRVVQTARQFFDLPFDTKAAYATGKSSLNRGYFPPEAETLGIASENGGKRLPDLKEAYVAGRPDVSDDLLALAGADTAYEPNRWPALPDGFREAMEDYYQELSALCFRLLRVFAYSLDLPESYFEPHFEKHPSVLRVINYPARAEAPSPGQLRAGAHTDYGAITILKEGDATGGLQVRTRAGEWVDIRSAPDSFVINIGNVMMRWTNDRWISNLHRVSNPSADSGWKNSRISIPYFVHSRPNALIECLPTCHDATRPAKYTPIMAVEHRMQQLRQAETKRTRNE